MMNILPVVFKQICQFSTLNFSKGHTFLEILLPDLSPLWTPVLENMNLFSVQFRKGNNLSWGPCVAGLTANGHRGRKLLPGKNAA